MKSFPKHIDWTPKMLLKVAGAGFLVVIILSFAFRLIGTSLTPLSRTLGGAVGQGLSSAPSFNRIDMDMSEEAFYGGEDGAIGLSVRNVAGSIAPPSPADPIVGDDAESFEVSEYTAHIETRKLTETCADIRAWKTEEEIIFERSDEYEESCHYSFKVTKDRTADILTRLEALDPREMNESTYSIKKRIDDFTSQEDILKKKQASIEATLEEAIAAYDDITRLARQSQNADALANVIDSKVRIIERLTNERINVSVQLDQLARAKEAQLDRLTYTYFHVSVMENKYIDGQELSDSWKQAVRQFVRDVNETLQQITIGLIALLFTILQIALYVFVVFMTVKYAWRWGKSLWKK